MEGFNTSERDRIIRGQAELRRALQRANTPGSAVDPGALMRRVRVQGRGVVGPDPDALTRAMAGAILALGRGIGEKEAMISAKAMMAEMERQGFRQG